MAHNYYQAWRFRTIATNTALSNQPAGEATIADNPQLFGSYARLWPAKTTPDQVWQRQQHRGTLIT